MADFCGQILLAFLVFSVLCISSVYTGECCKEYTVLLQSYPAQWCSDYCCYDPKTVGLTYYCCSNDLLRADADMRDSSCIEWWGAHIYAPILIGVAVLVIVVLTCCCCCCCCRRQSPGYIVQGQASTGPVVMVQQQQQQQTMTHQDPMHYGYNQ